MQWVPSRQLCYFTDQIRPDWEAKLAAVRAAVTRRANRRIIMRQVGDRLIPVGVTSGRPQPNPDEAGGESADNGGSRRSRRRQQPANEGFAQYVGMGQDLEEVSSFQRLRQRTETYLCRSTLRLCSWKPCGFRFWIMKNINERKQRKGGSRVQLRQSPPQMPSLPLNQDHPHWNLIH